MKLIYWPNNILNKPSIVIPEFEFTDSEHNKSLIDFSNRMIDLMHQHNGVGLSAIQVGLPIRMFVMDCSNCPDRIENNYSPKPMVIINPIIEELIEPKIKLREGCLSFPGVFEEVERYSEVIISCRDTQGANLRYLFSGTEAQCVQHEIDHLDGITMGDNWGRVKKDIAKRKISKNK